MWMVVGKSENGCFSCSNLSFRLGGFEYIVFVIFEFSNALSDVIHRSVLAFFSRGFLLICVRTANTYDDYTLKPASWDRFELLKRKLEYRKIKQNRENPRM